MGVGTRSSASRWPFAAPYIRSCGAVAQERRPVATRENGQPIGHQKHPLTRGNTATVAKVAAEGEGFEPSKSERPYGISSAAH